MRPEQRDPAYLWDMLDRARQVQEHVGGVSLEQFVADRKLQSAVERCIEVIGEAARRVSSGFKDRHTEIPWRPIIAQRNILAHEYDNVLPERIYRVATVHIPELVRLLEPLVTPDSGC